MCLIRFDSSSVRGYSCVDVVLWVRIGMRALLVFVGQELSDCFDDECTFQFSCTIECTSLVPSLSLGEPGTFQHAHCLSSNIITCGQTKPLWWSPCMIQWSSSENRWRNCVEALKPKNL